MLATRFAPLLSSLALACGQTGAPPPPPGALPVAPMMPAVPMPGVPAIAPAPTPPPPATPFTIATGPLTPAEAAPGCAPSAANTGSLHANVLYETIMLTPTAKTRQSFDCAGTPVGVLYFVYASDADAASAAEYAGASLWGGPGPTSEHPDEVLRAGPVMAVVSSRNPQPMVALLAARRGFTVARQSAVASAPRPAPLADLDAATVAGLKASIDCASPVEARYCAAMDGFAAGRPAPMTPAALVGSSLAVRRGRAAANPVNAEEVNFLVFNATGVRYGIVTPSNPEEAQQMQQLLATLRQGAPVPPTDPVRQYVQTLTSQPGRPAAVSGQSLTFDAEHRIYVRDTGAALVVIEVASPSEPFWVGIFPRQ